jgi:hypothetical protein
MKRPLLAKPLTFKRVLILLGQHTKNYFKHHKPQGIIRVHTTAILTNGFVPVLGVISN